MRPMARDSSITIGRREAIRVQGPAGTTVRVLEGEVWMTRHRDTEDHLLGAGDMLQHAGRGDTVLTAAKGARVEIRVPSRPGLWSILAGAILRAREEAPDEEHHPLLYRD